MNQQGSPHIDPTQGNSRHAARGGGEMYDGAIRFIGTASDARGAARHRRPGAKALDRAMALVSELQSRYKWTRRRVAPGRGLYDYSKRTADHATCRTASSRTDEAAKSPRHPRGAWSPLAGAQEKDENRPTESSSALREQ